MFMLKKILFVLGILMMALKCFAGDPYVPSGLNTTFDVGPDTPFSDYIAHTRQMVAQARADLDGPDRDRIITANTPFERSPVDGRAHKGILLIHGLSDSPYQMNHLAGYFLSRGFLVRTLLLPGHGTRPGDLLDVTWESWVKATEYGVNRLAQCVDKLYIGGFSTGGELAVYMALTRDDVKGLFLFSPVMGIETPFAWFSTTFLAPRWLLKQEERDFARYDSLPANAVAQVYDLTRVVDRLLDERVSLDIPVFAALSEQDITVSSKKTIRMFTTQMTSDKNRMVVYSCDPDRFPPDPLGRVTVRDSRIPDRQILSFSHLSILVSPDDPHYGKNGDYIYSPHRLLRQKEDGVPPSEIYYGELLKRFRKHHVMQRLSYNPYFKEMTVEIDGFIERCQ
jgi:esterase/lipase